LPGDIADLIRTYRRENPTHGFKRIQAREALDCFVKLHGGDVYLLGKQNRLVRLYPVQIALIEFLVLLGEICFEDLAIRYDQAIAASSKSFGRKRCQVPCLIDQSHTNVRNSTNKRW
jgi:hypothetical protein